MKLHFQIKLVRAVAAHACAVDALGFRHTIDARLFDEPAARSDGGLDR